MKIMEDQVKYDSQSLLKWKTTENCTYINVLSFYKVKAKSLESLKLAHIVLVEQMHAKAPLFGCKQKVLGPENRLWPVRSQGRVKMYLGPASGQFMEEFLVQHLT